MEKSGHESRDCDRAAGADVLLLTAEACPAASTTADSAGGAYGHCPDGWRAGLPRTPALLPRHRGRLATGKAGCGHGYLASGLQQILYLAADVPIHAAAKVLYRTEANLQARVHALMEKEIQFVTLTVQEYVDRMIENERRVTDARFAAQKEAVDTAFVVSEKAIKLAVGGTESGSLKSQHLIAIGAAVVMGLLGSGVAIIGLLLKH